MWHRFDEFKAFVTVFGSFKVKLNIAFVNDNKHINMC